MPTTRSTSHAVLSFWAASVMATSIAAALQIRDGWSGEGDGGLESNFIILHVYFNYISLTKINGIYRHHHHSPASQQAALSDLFTQLSRSVSQSRGGQCGGVPIKTSLSAKRTN